MAAPVARPAMDDQALIAAVKAGQESVASVFCDRVWPQVDKTIRRLLGTQDADRDDVAQMALIELVNTISRYRGDCSLDTWAQTVTSHIVFKQIRRRRLERRIFTDLLADGVGETVASGSTERVATTRDVLARVAGHLNAMNEGRAWAFVMHDVLGYDLREIAQMTSTSVAATQSRLVRGRRELHGRIGEDDDLRELLTTIERGE
jgi:RNA polymerase sigma-70 factor (ECF subfamily)